MITRLPVKTLRYYDEVGVLKPARVDEATGYRYYGPREVEEAGLISLFRELDFGLADVAALASLAGEGRYAELAERLREHERAVAERKAAYEKLLARVRSFAEELEKEAKMDRYEVEEKRLDEEVVLTIRKTGRYEELGPMFETLMECALEEGLTATGPPMFVCLDQEYRAEAAHMEVAVPVGGSLDEVRRSVAKSECEARVLEGGRFLSTIHQGPYGEVGPVYQALMDEAQKRGLKLNGPTREVYLNDPSALPEDEYLTEVQAPVE